MNKFKKEIDQINISAYEKKEILEKIKNKKKNKKQIYLLRFAVIVLIFMACTTTTYALVKIFNFDETLKILFDKSEEELNNYGVGGTEVNNEYKFDDFTIKINQTVYDTKSLYISLDMIGKKEKVYIDNAFISEGTKFEEFRLEETPIENDKPLLDMKCTLDYPFCEQSMALLGEKENTLNYAYNFSINHEKDLINKPLTMRFFIDDEYYDITFILQNNKMKIKELDFDKVVYNQDGIIGKVKHLKITPMHIIVTFDYNVAFEDLTQAQINDLDQYVYNIMYSSNIYTYITLQNYSKLSAHLDYEHDEITFLKPTIDYVINENSAVIDIDTLKSLTINGVTFKIN